MLSQVSQAYIPALTLMETLFLFRLVGKELRLDPYLGAKQELTLLHFQQLKHSPSPCFSISLSNFLLMAE